MILALLIAQLAVSATPLSAPISLQGIVAPVTIPSNAVSYASLERQTGWTGDSGSDVAPHPPTAFAIVPAGGGGATMTLQTTGTAGIYTGWMAKKTVAVSGTHDLLRATYEFTSVTGIQAWEVGRRKTNSAGITDNGQTQLVPIAGSKLEFDIVPSSAGGWKDTGCRFPAFTANTLYDEDLYFVSDSNGALSLEYVSLNGSICMIPQSLQHIAGIAKGWSKNEMVVAFQPDANPKAIAYGATVTMSAWTW
jgi:hypothetical protein